MTRIALHAPHDPVTCANRLKTAVGDTLDADTPKRVTGNGTDEKMTLWVHRPHLRNDFKAVLNATMRADAGGTRIEGTVGTARGVRIFMMMWLGFVASFLVIALAIGMVARPPLAFILPFAGIPLLMLGFGLALFWFAGRSVTADSAAMIAFLEDTIDARPIADMAR